MHRDEILNEDDLPKKYFAYTLAIAKKALLIAPKKEV